MDIFKYNDYRTWLKQLLNSKKTKNKKYSLIYYSRLINSSDTYLKLVLSQKRVLNLDKARLLAKKLRLKSLETSYFLTLIMRDSAKTEELRAYFDEILVKFRELHKIQYSKKSEYKSIFIDALTWELYTLMGIDSFRTDLTWITKTLSNKNATPMKIKSSLNRLLEIGAIKKIDDKYKTKDIVLEHSEAKKEMYISAFLRAIEYLKTNKSETNEEYFDSFCLVLSDKEFKQIQSLLEDTKIKMVNIVGNAKKKDRICFFNSNLFYVSKKFCSL